MVLRELASPLCFHLPLPTGLQTKGLQSGLTICAQPRRILAQKLCERVKENRKMHYRDLTVGYVIAKESSRDSSTKLLYCTEAIVAIMMQAYLVSSDQPTPQELITTVIIDEVHNRSAHSDYVLALAAMQQKPTLRLVLMSATGDHNLVKGVNESNKIMVFLPGLAQIYQLCEILQRALDLGWTEMLILLPFHGQSSYEDVEAVLTDPSLLLAATGKYPLGQNKSLFDPESFEKFSAPPCGLCIENRDLLARA